jgi:hypothetical protein
MRHTGCASVRKKAGSFVLSLRVDVGSQYVWSESDG